MWSRPHEYLCEILANLLRDWNVPPLQADAGLRASGMRQISVPTPQHHQPSGVAVVYSVRCMAGGLAALRSWPLWCGAAVHA